MSSYRNANNKNKRCETCGHCAQDTRCTKKRVFRCYWTYPMRNTSVVSINKVCDEWIKTTRLSEVERAKSSSRTARSM